MFSAGIFCRNDKFLATDWIRSIRG